MPLGLRFSDLQAWPSQLYDLPRSYVRLCQMRPLFSLLLPVSRMSFFEFFVVFCIGFLLFFNLITCFYRIGLVPLNFESCFLYWVSFVFQFNYLFHRIGLVPLNISTYFCLGFLLLFNLITCFIGLGLVPINCVDFVLIYSILISCFVSIALLF